MKQKEQLQSNHSPTITPPRKMIWWMWTHQMLLVMPFSPVDLSWMTLRASIVVGMVHNIARWAPFPLSISKVMRLATALVSSGRLGAHRSTQCTWRRTLSKRASVRFTLSGVSTRHLMCSQPVFHQHLSPSQKRQLPSILWVDRSTRRLRWIRR